MAGRNKTQRNDRMERPKRKTFMIAMNQNSLFFGNFMRSLRCASFPLAIIVLIMTIETSSINPNGNRTIVDKF
ncbi:MAG: hypothetical protein LBC02_14515, partial [Planctomycetaceae bacterium]|nr:hypothetical protein [Planctomycetaceae bacterium]